MKTVPVMCQHMSHKQKAGTHMAIINDSGYIAVMTCRPYFLIDSDFTVIHCGDVVPTG